MSIEIIKVPDIGSDAADVIEVCVSAGDIIEAEDSLVVLESEKSSMEVPSPMSGKVVAVLVNEDDSVSEGAVLIEIDVSSESAHAGNVEDTPTAAPALEVAVEAPAAAEAAPVATTGSSLETIKVPDIGGEAEVIEICVSVGDEIAEEDSLVVLESEKSSMEVPAPQAGIVESIEIKEGVTANEGDVILTLKVIGATAVEPELPTPAADAKQTIKEPAKVAEQHQPVTGMTENRPTGDVYAGPAVRKMAREVGLDLVMVPGSGPRGRISKDDVKSFIKGALKNKATPVAAASGGMGIPQVPEVDFSKFGEVDIQKLSKMGKVTAANMHRAWLNVPHVTNFDDIDITDLEAFRATLKKDAEKAGVKITPLPFLLKALAVALKANPIMNSSLSADGESIVYKNYIHIGMAVDTPAGLMVPVIRDVDKKTLFELAAETAELAQKAKDRKLKPQDMQGASFSISSLGPMGGTGFTPIVNTPEVAILGVSKLEMKPVWNGTDFEPRKMLPVSLSYDHRAVNGADAGRFLMMFNSLLADIRRMIV